MVAHEYAKALYELALSSKKEDLILNELKVFTDSLKENDEYVKLLTFPSVSDTQKKESLDIVLKDANPLLLNFVKVLVDNKRVNIIFEIYEEYYTLYLKEKNIVNVKIISSEILSEDKLNHIKSQLSNHYKKDIVLENLIDESLIAGYKFIANGEEVDFSIVNKMSKLKESI